MVIFFLGRLHYLLIWSREMVFFQEGSMDLCFRTFHVPIKICSNLAKLYTFNKLYFTYIQEGLPKFQQLKLPQFLHTLFSSFAPISFSAPMLSRLFMCHPHSATVILQLRYRHREQNGLYSIRISGQGMLGFGQIIDMLLPQCGEAHSMTLPCFSFELLCHFVHRITICHGPLSF